jgi:Repeat of unknown function (DUF5907)
MKKLRILLALAAVLLTAPALAQGVPFYPQTLPPNTVAGRLGVGPGPTQAIPFNALAAAFLGATVLTGDVTGSGISPIVTSINPGAVTNSKLAVSGAASLKGNPTASSTTPQDFTLQSLTNLASPSGTLDFLVIYDHSTGLLKNVTPNAIAGVNTAGVSTLNGLAGAVTIAGSGGISIAAAGTTVTVSSSSAAFASAQHALLGGM